MKAMTKAGVGDGEGGVACLEDVAKQFKHWRQCRVRGEHIPAALWDQAVRLCQQHACQRVAGVLRISLIGLMRRLQRGGDHAAHRGGLDTEFVELVMSSALPATPEPAASRLELVPPPEPPTRAAAPTPAYECVFELENARGAKMRIVINGHGLASLGPVFSSFWGAT